jgi:acetyl-CoA carboxylase biotin carboxylase subunit
MVRVDTPGELAERFAVASSEAEAAFGDGRMYVERYVERARHVEVQLLGDHHGNVIHLGDRDCSTQRRFQKLIEEAPAAVLGDDLRQRIADAAVALGRELGYVGAGTVEFLVDLDRQEFSFLEINTRVQVEHPVTEMVTGVDIVRAQLRIAVGEPVGLHQNEVTVRGHAIECRVNAESAVDGFLPSPGTITRWEPPTDPWVRIDSHGFEGYTIPPYYDSLLAKLIVTGADRAEAVDRSIDALGRFGIGGVNTTSDLIGAVLDHDDFRRDAVTTRWLETTFLPTWSPVDRYPITTASA